MRGCGNRRQAVIFNDIVSLNIDAKLIESQNGDTTNLPTRLLRRGFAGQQSSGLAPKHQTDL